MANDPNLTDTCFFMEATPGDGGTHTGNPFWLSPDVQVVGPTSGADKADKGVANTINVKVHRNANALPVGTGSVQVEVWVGNPSLAMAPSVNTKLTGTAGIATPAANAAATGSVSWTPAGTGTDPDAAGHRCLIARCFADVESPDPAAFYVPGDPHYVQHNITVVEVPAGGAPKKISIFTGNGSKIFQATVVQAVEDTKPSRFVQAAVLPVAQKSKSFKALAVTPSKGFTIDSTRLVRATTTVHATGVAVGTVLNPTVKVSEVLAPGITTAHILKPGVGIKAMLQPRVSLRAAVLKTTPVAVLEGTKIQAAALTDNTKVSKDTGKFGKLASPNFSAAFTLAPQVFNTFDFTVDVSKSKPGTAHIFQLTQVGNDKTSQGGLTVVVIAK